MGRALVGLIGPLALGFEVDGLRERYNWSWRYEQGSRDGPLQRAWQTRDGRLVSF